MIPENFIPRSLMWDACLAEVRRRDPARVDRHMVDVDALVGELTGLDMSRYRLEYATDLLGWYITKREPA